MQASTYECTRICNNFIHRLAPPTCVLSFKKKIKINFFVTLTSPPLSSIIIKDVLKGMIRKINPDVQVG